MFLAALLLASTLHAGPERAVQPPPRDAQPYEQRFGDVTAGDGLALVTWTERPDLLAARVDRDGRTLDAGPIAVVRGAVHSAAARGHNGWLVVWVDHLGISARTVADDGTLGQPVAIASPMLMSLVNVAFDGTSHLIVWLEGTQFMGARVSAAGSVVESAFPIAPHESRHPEALIAGRDGGFVLVAWLQTIDALRLDARGRAQSSERVAIPEELRHVVAGLDAEGQLAVLWRDGDTMVLKRGDVEPQELGSGTPRAIIAAGGATYVLFERLGDVVLEDADRRASRVWDVAYRTDNSGAASFGDRLLVAAVTVPPIGPETLVPPSDLYVGVVDAALEDVEPVRLLYAEPRLQFLPAIAGDAMVWIEPADEERRRQLVARIGRGAPFVVADDVDTTGKPRVAASGDGFLVLWLGRDLRPWARHVGRDGTLGEPLRIEDERVTGKQCVVWTGSEYVAAFVVVKLANRLSIISEVWAQPLTRTGAIVAPPVPLTGPGYYLGVSCAASETTTLFAFEGTRIDGAVRTHAGSVSAPFIITFGFSRDLSVASTGSGFLVGWASARAPVSDAGTVGTPVPTAAEDASVAAWRDGYVLLTGSSGTLTATPLDAQGAATGETVVLAHDAASAELSGSTVIYQRDTGSLHQPRWQVFTRELAGTPTRRRAVR